MRNMLHIFPRIRGLIKSRLIDSFTANVIILVTGTTLTQLITIAAAPFLTRIYSPAEFGVFAIYTSLVTIISVVATGKYELAILLPEKPQESFSIMALCLMLASFTSLAGLVLILVWQNTLYTLLGLSTTGDWIYYVPLAVLVTGIVQSFNYWINRGKGFKLLARARIVQSIITTIGSIALGFAG
jgi:O-antigen/teichoic acid export membrane protein